MTNNISSDRSRRSRRLAGALVAGTILMAGRAMTLWFVGRAGDGGPGDPPSAWLMPLLGDAFIGISAIAVAVLIWRRRTPATWLIAIVWNALGAWDAVSAYLVNEAAPWPEFFMLEALGSSMFFAATLLHLALIAVIMSAPVRAHFGVGLGAPEGSRLTSSA